MSKPTQAFWSRFVEKKTIKIGILLTITLVVYFKAPSIFFIQDEMMALGLIIGYGNNFLVQAINLGFPHFVPITYLMEFIFFKIFGLNIVAYNLAGLTIHFINGVLVYFLALRFSKNQIVAMLSGVFFLTSSVASQFVLWPVISLNTLSLTFALLAILITVARQGSRNLLKIGVILTVFVLASVLTIEYALSLLVFIPILFLLTRSNETKKEILFITPFITGSLAYIFLRSYLILVSVHSGAASSFNLLKIPRYFFRYLGQIILPENYILAISNLIAHNNPSFQLSMFTKIAEILGILFLLLMTWTLIISKKLFPKDRSLLISLAFVYLSVIPFLFIPGEGSGFDIFPSRYLYFGVAALALTISSLLNTFNKRRHFYYLTIVIIVLLICFNIANNSKIEIDYLSQGSIRQNILTSIKINYSKLPDKVVFYLESDSSYYGLPAPERIPPFQSGFGQTLLVWYYPQVIFPKQFYRDRFLWEITDQGYKVFDSRGYGYYRNFDDLAGAVKKTSFNLNNVLSFQFDSTTNTLSDISKEVRGRLEGYLTNKVLIDQGSYKVTGSNNNIDIYKAVDGNINTYWDSKLPYNNRQYINIDLMSNKIVPGIIIDSEKNKNQDKVGYDIFTSQDNVNWQRVFHSSIYPPNQQGLDYIYFKPQPIRYIRIEQIGRHKYASWIIYELNIYQKV